MSGNTIVAPWMPPGWILSLWPLHEPMRPPSSCTNLDHSVLDIDLFLGGVQLWPDLGVADVESFADYVLVGHHVILTASSNYAPVLQGFIRFSTELLSTTIERDVQMVGQILSEWRQR